MKKLLGVILLLVTLPLAGQLRQQTSVTVQNVNQHVIVATITDDVTRTFAINNGATRHQVTFKSAPSVTAVTVTVNATANDNTYSQVGTSALLNDSIVFYCVCTGANVVTTGYTGSGAIEVDYYGDTPTSQAVGLTAAPFNTAIGAVADSLKVHITGNTDGINTDVNVAQINGVTPLMGNGVTGTGSPRVTIASDNTAFSVNAIQSTAGATAWPVTQTIGTAVTDYAGSGVTVITLSATSGTSITTETVYWNMIRCYNTTAGAITVSRTDTADNQFEVAYSIPANSNYYLESPGSFTKMVGLELWASAVSSLNCVMNGKQ